MTNNPSILIVGYGNIGKHLHNELHGAGHIDKYDTADLVPTDHRNSGYECRPRPQGHYDFAFICVPTDMNEDGSADISIVEETVKWLDADVIVIKSTVPVGTMYALGKYGKRLVYSPEYYGTTQHAPAAPNFMILAGKWDDCNKVAQLYYKVKSGSFRIRFTEYRTAELAKYMENCFLALKVTFCAEFASLAKNFGVFYEELRELFVMDERMGDSHTFVHSDKPYYDSHCLNKDIPALLSQANWSMNAPLLHSMHLINLSKKEANK